MINDEVDAKFIEGVVKWFDPTKGFGFILADGGGPDILLHANVLRNFGQSSIAEGTAIEVSVVETDRGLQANQVLKVDQGASPGPAALSEFSEVDAAVLADAPIQPARVKWFDKSKGFGFANIFGNTADVFVHAEVLRLSGLADLLPGEAIALRAVEGKRGLMAAEVLPWENAL